MKKSSQWKIVTNTSNDNSKKKVKAKVGATSGIAAAAAATSTTIFAVEEDERNLKKMLCQNIIRDGECGYGTKCLYAHCLNDQNVDDRRKVAYDLIMNKHDLYGIELRKNYPLYKTLLELTKLCKSCMEGACIGGYNCKSGACLRGCCICFHDLTTGNCRNVNCNFIHLTKRGMKPYYNNTKREYSHKLNNYHSASHTGTNFTPNDDNSDISDFDNRCGNDSDSEIDTGPNSNDEIKKIYLITNTGQITDEKYITLICEKSIFS